MNDTQNDSISASCFRPAWCSARRGAVQRDAAQRVTACGIDILSLVFLASGCPAAAPRSPFAQFRARTKVRRERVRALTCARPFIVIQMAKSCARNNLIGATEIPVRQMFD